jgi:hypothetical protein
MVASGQTVEHAKLDQFGIALDSQLFHKPDLVSADGLDAPAQRHRDVTHALTVTQQRHHLAFTLGQVDIPREFAGTPAFDDDRFY